MSDNHTNDWLWVWGAVLGFLAGMGVLLLLSLWLDLAATTGDQMVLDDGTRLVKLCDLPSDSWTFCDDWYRVEGPVILETQLVGDNR